MTEESTFFQDGDIAVTNARFIVGAQTFAMRGITSVEGVETPVSYIGPAFLGIIALFMTMGLFSGEIALGIVAVFLLIADIWIVICRKPTFTVVLRTAGGEVTAYRSTNRDLIARIIRALNYAIISHG